MAQGIKGNYNALTWLQEELQSSLALALNAMNQYIDHPQETKYLADCIEAIYQIRGSLEMLNLNGAFMLADEIQHAVVAIRDNTAKESQAAQESVVRALLLLPNYLNMLSEEFEDHPLSLLTNINEIRKARGVSAVDEMSLFQPVFNVPLPDRVAPDPHRKLPRLKIEKNKLAHAYQLHLLSWFKNQDDDSLQKMRNIIHFMRMSSQEEKTTLLWWAAEAYMDALAGQALEVGNKTKLILGKLIPPIKTQTETDEKSLLLTFPNDLLSRLMLKIAKASNQSANVALLKVTFGLNFFDQRQKIYSMSDNALSNAHQGLLEQLQEIKSEIEQYEHEHENGFSVIEQVTKQLQSMSDTLALLEEYEASNLLHTQYEHLDVLLSNEQKPDDETLTELADALLKVENLIESSSAQTVNADLRTVVMSECLLEMSNIKEAMILISRGQSAASSEFSDITRQLTQISASLDMLNYPEAAQVLSSTADKISSYANEGREFNSGQLNQLADILACCDIFMEGINQHGQEQNQFLDDAQQKLAQFDTVTEQTAEESVSAEAADTDTLTLESAEAEAEAEATLSLQDEAIHASAEPLAAPSPQTDNSLPTQDQWQFAENIDSEIAEIFIEEAVEVLAELEQLLPAWLQQNDDSQLNDIRRHFHTLKGSGRMAGASVIGELAWSVEQVLNHVLQRTRADSAQVKQLASQAYQHMPVLLSRFARADLSSDETVTALTRLSENCLNGSAQQEAEPAQEQQPEVAEELTAEQFDSLTFEIPELEVTETEADITTEDSLLSFDTTESDVLTVEDDSEPFAELQADALSLDIPSLDDDATVELVVDLPLESASPVLTSVEQYIQAYSEDKAAETLSSVERYIQQHNIVPAHDAPADTSSLSFSDTTAGDETKLSSVEQYIQSHSDRTAATGVERYLQQQAANETLTDDARRIAEPVEDIEANISSVEQYIQSHNALDELKTTADIRLEADADQAALSSVEHYIQNKADTTVEHVTETVVAPVTISSVERYIQRLNQPLSSVERYIRQQVGAAAQQPVGELDEEANELQQIFRNEAREHIQALNEQLELIEQQQLITKQALRSIHSLKGCANIAAASPMAEVATEMNLRLNQLHSRQISLSDEQVASLTLLVAGLENILHYFEGQGSEPDILELNRLMSLLEVPDAEEDADVAVMDPEFLLVFLQETDELLSDYTEQLSHWQQQSDDAENTSALIRTLSMLHEGALQAEQPAVAQIYTALSELVQHSNSNAPGLKQIFEQGYDELNQLIELLLQNKPIKTTPQFPQEVAAFLNADISSDAQADNAEAIVENAFALPQDIDVELLEAFTEEAEQLLNSSLRAIQNWLAGNQTEQSVQQLQRDLHTIKGGARLSGLTPMADLTHHVESLVNAVQDQQLHADGAFFALLLRCQDKLAEMHEQVAGQQAITTAHGLIAEISALTEQSADMSDIPTAVTEPLDIDEAEFAIPQDVDPDLLEAFTEEAAELLLSSDNAIKQWQSTIQTTEAAQQLQRDLHTIKGGARLAGITPMADLTHKLETLIQHIDQNPSLEDENFFDLLQRCQDKLSEMQEQLARRQPITTAYSLIEEIALLSGDKPPVAPSPQPQHAAVDYSEKVKSQPPVPVHSTEQVRVRADVLDDLTNYAGEISISRDRVTQQHYAMQQQLREMEETVSRLRDQLRKLEIETETQILFRYEDEQLHQNQEFDPLELDRFSMIQQLSRGLSESVIDLLDISQSMESLSRETDTLLLQQSRLNTDLQHGLMYTRLLPFSTITPRMERIVRQTANELGKQTELSISGADIELDRAILDRLIAPIEHILRNAIAHGIETAEQRQANGKDKVGHLHMRMVREGSEMLLTIEDDGQGINIEKVKQKALNQGLIDQHNIPSDDELVQLILHSGFSTADNVSQVSGRGVGMDVVSNEIRALKGRLSIKTKPGKGTTFTVRLPLTLSVIQSLLVSVDNEQYAMPLGSINAGERLKVADIKTLLATPDPKYHYDGVDYDFIPLATLLDKPLTLPEQDKLQLPLLLFRSGDIRLAILVDAVKGNREIVIKPVGKQLSHIRVINGATILGDGRVVFILDIPTLIDIGLDKLKSANKDAVELQHELERIQDHPPTAMVVDDSITMRKATGNLLGRLGFDVMTAKDGVDALSQLHNQTPDIILLDVEMPRMDGFEFASMVRNDIKFRHLPIIMITSRTGDKHRERAMNIGVNAYLGKPYQEEALVENMKKLLGDRYFQGQD